MLLMPRCFRLISCCRVICFFILFQYENIIASMREETKTLVQQHLAEANNLKAKIAYEIQEREKERADHMAMMK